MRWWRNSWAATPTGGWLAQHAAEYGFVTSYPRGKSAVTCYCGVRDSAHAKQMTAAKLPEYDYEPWHDRWVGRDVAARVMASRRTLREFQSGIR